MAFILSVVAICVLSSPFASAGTIHELESFKDSRVKDLNSIEGNLDEGHHSCHCLKFYCRCCMTHAISVHGKPYIYHPCLGAHLIPFINLFVVTVSMNNEVLLKTPIRRRHVSVCYSLPDPPTAHRTCLEFYHHEPWLLHMCARILVFFPKSLERYDFGCFMMRGWGPKRLH